jgi:hypothetical protein
MTDDELNGAVEFLDWNHGFGWDQPMLDRCHCIFFHQGYVCTAMIWLDPDIREGSTWLEAHICVNPDFQKKWALRNELEVLMELQDLIEPSPEGVCAVADQHKTWKILRTLGFFFSEDKPLAFIPFKEKKNGKEEECPRA